MTKQIIKNIKQKENDGYESRTIKSANKTVYVEHWIMLYGKELNDGVTAAQLPDGRWVCELELPRINQTIKVVAKTAINAMFNYSIKAVALIDKYLSENPEVWFYPKSQFHHYEFFIDENGYVGIRLNVEYAKKQSEKN